MKTLNDFISDISNRELSIILWLLLLLMLTLLSQSTRKSFSGVIKAFFCKAFIKIYFCLALYLLPVIYLFMNTVFWNTKDFIFWLFTVGFVLIFSFKKIDEKDFFKNKLIESFKIILILEFIINFYNFSFWIEFILVPIVIFYALLIAVAEIDKKDKRVSNVLNGILIVVGLIYSLLSTYNTIMNNEDFFSLTTLWTFLFPLLLTIIFLPFLYFLTLYRKYDSLSVRLKYLAKTDENSKLLKKEIRKVANMSISRITNISKNIGSYELLNSTDWNKYLKEISRIKKDN